MDNLIDDSKQSLANDLVDDAPATGISLHAINPDADFNSDDQQKNDLEKNDSEFFAEKIASEEVSDEEKSLEERLNELEAPSAGAQQVSSSIDSNNAQMETYQNTMFGITLTKTLTS